MTADHVMTSAANGVGLAGFPTTAEAARACRDHDIAVMMGAPTLIRGTSHSGSVAAETLARADTPNILSLGYVPSALSLASFRLAAVWADLSRGVATVTRSPARTARLDDRGALVARLRGSVQRAGTVGDTPLLRGVRCCGAQVA
ncbi:MAG: hypothetical protein AAF762_07590 [Pseudomonadota bacterium]